MRSLMLEHPFFGIWQNQTQTENNARFCPPKNVCKGLTQIQGSGPHVLFDARTRSLHTGINLYVCNMSLSDMMMCLIAAPLTPITSFTGQWYLGETACKILPACQVSHNKCLEIAKHLLQGVSVYMSTLSLTAIALDRLVAVTHINTVVSNRETIIKIILINVTSVIATLPYSLHMEVIMWKFAVKSVKLCSSHRLFANVHHQLPMTNEWAWLKRSPILFLIIFFSVVHVRRGWDMQRSMVWCS